MPTHNPLRPIALWQSTAPRLSTHSPLENSLTADVTVIGAGFTGLRAALELAESGLNVVVLEAKEVGWGASGRTGGQVNPMLPFVSPERLKKLVGDHYAAALTEASLNSADELFGLIAKHQIDCQARQRGWLRALHSKNAHASAQNDIKLWNAYGAGMRLIEGDELAALSGTTEYNSGVISPRGGAVQPAMLVEGLADAAKKRGTQIFTQSSVKALEKRGSRWLCRTERGEVESDWVVVATNAYSDDLIPALSKSIIPICPIQIATEPLDDAVIETILPQGHTISDSRRIIMFARREPDNRIVYGSLGKMDKDGEVSGFDWLKKDARRVFPVLENAEWTHQWGGEHCDHRRSSSTST